MTAIVGIRKDNIIYMGADSQTTTAKNVKTHYVSSVNNKIQIVRDTLVAGTGSVSATQVLPAHPEWFDFNRDEGLTKRWLVLYLIPRLKEAMEKRGLLEHKNGVYEMAAEYLIAWKDRLFEIGSSLEVIEYKDWQALGSGALWTLYDISHRDEDRDINETILDALRVASQHEAGVGAPYVLVNTRDQEYTVVEE